MFSLEAMVFLLILLILCGIGLLKFSSYWLPVFKALYNTLLELVDFFCSTDFKSLTAEENAAPKAKEPLTKSNFLYRFAIPLTLTVSFAVLFLLVKELNTVIMQNQAQGDALAPIVISVGVVILLGFLVIMAFEQSEKNPRRKFWLRLMVTLALEVGVVFDLHLLLSGYFFQNARTGKSLVAALLFIPCFIQSGFKTQRNWQAWQQVKYPELFAPAEQNQQEAQP